MSAATNPVQLRILEAYAAAGRAPPGSREARAHEAARQFEATFVQSMLQAMTSGLGAEGPLGGGEAGGAWRGFLLDEMARGISRAPSGGFGVAPQVYREMMRLQEARG